MAGGCGHTLARSAIYPHTPPGLDTYNHYHSCRRLTGASGVRAGISQSGTRSVRARCWTARLWHFWSAQSLRRIHQYGSEYYHSPGAAGAWLGHSVPGSVRHGDPRPGSLPLTITGRRNRDYGCPVPDRGGRSATTTPVVETGGDRRPGCRRRIPGGSSAYSLLTPILRTLGLTSISLS